MRLRLRGFVWIRKNGVLVHSGPNIIVTAGFELLAGIIGASSTKPSHMAFGDSNTAPALAQTALQGTEAQRKTVSTGVSTRTITYTSAAFGPGLGSDKTAREFGIFNAGAAGTMLARFITPDFPILTTDSVVVTWSVTIGD